MSILFITPAFLARRLHKHVRGVQVFDIQLLRALVGLGLRITVVADGSWRPQLDRSLAGRTPEMIYTPSLLKPIWNTLPLALQLRGRRFETLLVGNVSNGMTPAILLCGRVCDRTVIIAHRTPRPLMLRAMRGRVADVLAVNAEIGRAFHALGAPTRITVRYGLANAEIFHPPSATAGRPFGAPVRFVVVGKLDTRMKRADRAIAAFLRLPLEVRESAELHLAGYPQPPTDLPNGVIAYPWQSVEQIAELLRSMDICLVPSDPGETFSQAAVQAMLSGLPLIVSDLPPLVEKVETGAGIVFRTDDELLEGMIHLAKSKEARQRMGAIGRSLALARYKFDATWFASVALGIRGVPPADCDRSCSPDPVRVRQPSHGA